MIRTANCFILRNQEHPSRMVKTKTLQVPKVRKEIHKESPNREQNKKKHDPDAGENSFLGEGQMELFLDKFMNFVMNRKMVQEKQTQLDNFSQLLTQMTQS